MTVERQKRHLLDELGLSSRPPYIYRRLKIPSALANLREDEDEEQNQGGALHKIKVEPVERGWTYHSANGIVSDHFQFHLNSINDDIISASFIINSKLPNISVSIFEVDEVSDELKYIDRLEIPEIVENESVDFGNLMRNWIKSRQMNRVIKLEIKDLFTSNPLDSREVLNTLPHFEVTVFQSYTHRRSNCDGCCVTPFYVNFTEIGWNDWILYPQGFWANYCSGSCKGKTDDNYELIRRLAVDKSLIPEPTCAPNYYGSIDIVIALSPVDIRRTRAHGMRVFSCSCL